MDENIFFIHWCCALTKSTDDVFFRFKHIVALFTYIEDSLNFS